MSEFVEIDIIGEVEKEAETLLLRQEKKREKKRSCEDILLSISHWFCSTPNRNSETQSLVRQTKLYNYERFYL